MTRILLLVLGALLALANPQPVASNATTEALEQSTSQQILVMLRRPPAHYRGSGPYQGGYIDARSIASREQTGRRLAKAHGIRFIGFYPMAGIGLDCLILETDEQAMLTNLIMEIERDGEVEWAEPVQSYQPLSTASYNDPLFASAPAAKQWHLAELHRIATGKGVTVAVVDSGIDGAHPDLAGQVKLTRNFVDGRVLSAEAHGTGVAGVIAAKANNELGIVGIAPGSSLLGLRACWQDRRKTFCDSLSLAKALNFAVEKKVDVLNLSLTGPTSRLLTRLIERAIANRSVVVASIDPGVANGGFPASMSGVVAVADHSANSKVIKSYRAPGNGIPTTEPNGKWNVVNGSSYSAAHVSGLFALLIETRGGSRQRPVLVKLNDGSGTIDARASLRKAGSR